LWTAEWCEGFPEEVMHELNLKGWKNTEYGVGWASQGEERKQLLQNRECAGWADAGLNPVILATREVEWGGLWFEISPVKNAHDKNVLSQPIKAGHGGACQSLKPHGKCK
jgi:hypothetical protein